MNQEEFARFWTAAGEPLDKFDNATIDGLVVSDKTKAWLKVGLPSEPDPAFNLGPGAGAFLQSVSEECGLPEEFAQFRVIGFTVYDDPICLDEGTEEIVFFSLDQEDDEEELDTIYMNKSIGEFCAFLALFHDYATKMESAVDEDREEIAASTLASMRSLDEEAVDDGNFWHGEVDAYTEEEGCIEDEEE